MLIQNITKIHPDRFGFK